MRMIVHANGRFYSSRHSKQMSISSYLISYDIPKIGTEVVVYYNEKQIVLSRKACWIRGRKYPDDMHLFILD